MKAVFSALSSRLPWIVIGLLFLWAAAAVARRHGQKEADGGIVIRLAHWQLEAGVREGFAEAAAAYAKLHPHVRIVQEAIPESTYGQWLSTQLMGGTAPDIIEAGMVEPPLMTAFYNRYLLPISPYITQPNPYNAGTPLANVPLHRTFKDGLIRSFVPEVQEFMVLPLAMSSLRLYYNRSLLHQLTGLEEPPTEFRAFMKMVDTIQSQNTPHGEPYRAFTGSKFHFVRMEDAMAKPLTYGALRKIDFNRDGRFSIDEMFLGFATEKIGFDDPAYRAFFRMVGELTRVLPPGWAGLARDEALFQFAQQRAVFTAAGIYEAAGIQDQARGKFELGVMDFPVPLPTDPEFGAVLEGPRYEKPDGNMPMAITRTSKHPEIAADFLLFLTSLRQNEIFNARLKWIPIITGARGDPSVRVFEPNLRGVFPAFDPNIFGNTFIKWNQLYTLHQIGQLSYEDLAHQFTAYYTTQGREDFREFLRNRRRAQLQDEQLLVGLRQSARAQTGTASDWIKYRTIVATRQADGDKTLLQQNRVFTEPEALARETFYQYSPAALENIARQAAPSTP
ncbi:MAG: carbohydrate ABC transporter substrate-binding protein [Chthoniobacterales bacterium]|nr:carbohydrate ABC transporter substrate-binding protein [Chthoniobacterales bacterium]